MNPKKRREIIQSIYFRWKLYIRNGIYWADGRSNARDVGRHSLGATLRTAALEMLRRLDTQMAIEHGLIENPTALTGASSELGIDDGIQAYLQHARRSPQLGGTKPKTSLRYASILRNFQAFAVSKRISTWQGATKQVIEAFVGKLESDGKAPSTIGHEINILKQVVRFFIDQDLLPAKSRIKLRVKVPDGTTTYCWHTDEIEAMLIFCRARPELKWLERVIVGLTCTGLRISELIGLRWSDIIDGNMIRLTDERARQNRVRARKVRTIKNGRGRSFPINGKLRVVLADLPRLSDGLVFHDGDGNALTGDLVRRTLVNRVLIPMKDQFPAIEGETGFQDGRLHSFRHYFCSECSNSGVPENAVKVWLGHSDSKMVRHYYHLHDPEALRLMQNVKFFTLPDHPKSNDRPSDSAKPVCPLTGHQSVGDPFPGDL